MDSADGTVVALDHAMVRHHLSILRNSLTAPSAFRIHLRALSTILAVEVTRNLPVEPVTVQTPIEETTCHQLSHRVAVVPVLRAGLGMVDPLVSLLPDLEVWHLGVYRDEETAMPVHYYDKLPDSHPPQLAIIADPMLATGGSICMAADALKRWGVPKIQVVSIIAAPEGIARVQVDHPDVGILTCAIDRQLNEKKYICPGLGDAGDRIFNTLPV
ncbi:MAG: uracil phosphoribosyltransferase [Planctomycetaceae bacterium]|nr:uracil phosphoribosyltransferase [Planctomycetaceae bacterium]